MDGTKFDSVARALAATKGRRSLIKGLAGAALAGGAAIGGAAGPGAATVSCNTDEKCGAKCGTERALCCNGKCIRGGCGPDRALNLATCKCCRVDEVGRPTNTGCTAPKYCGA